MHRNEGNAKPTGTRSATVSFRKPGDWACITTGCPKTQKICSDFFQKSHFEIRHSAAPHWKAFTRVQKCLLPLFPSAMQRHQKLI